MWRRLLQRLAGSGPAPAPLTTLAVLTTSRGWTSEEIRVAANGESIEVSEANNWVPVCTIARDELGTWFSPVPGRVGAKLNGLPLVNATLVSTGDVLEFRNGVFGLTFESSIAQSTPVTEAEAFAGDLRAGLISLRDTPGGKHVQVRWRGGVDELTRFAQSALARSATTLDIIACRGRQTTVDAERISALADCMGELLPRCTFVIPVHFEVGPSIATRVSEAVDLSLDGRAIAGDSFWWLHASGEDEGIRPSTTCTRAPYLNAIGSGRFLSFELGWGHVESIRLIGHDVEITETPKFQLALLPGDEWLITTKTGTQHRLLVTPSGAGPTLISAAERLAPPSFDAAVPAEITFFHHDTDIVFTRGADGLFRGPSPGLIGAVGAGEFVWLTQSQTPFELFDETWVGSARAIALPAPSPFLRGRTRLRLSPSSASFASCMSRKPPRICARSCERTACLEGRASSHFVMDRRSLASNRSSANDWRLQLTRETSIPIGERIGRVLPDACLEDQAVADDLAHSPLERAEGRGVTTESLCNERTAGVPRPLEHLYDGGVERVWRLYDLPGGKRRLMNLQTDVLDQPEPQLGKLRTRAR